jgi:hypothetical protein
MATEEPARFPATGGFPGYQTGTRLFLAWSRALKSQADLLNAAWSSMKDGKYEAKDAMTLMARSLEIPATLIKDLWLLPTGGEFVPAWIHVPCKADGTGAAAAVPLTRLVTSGEDVKSTPLTLLGLPASGTFVAPTMDFALESSSVMVTAPSGTKQGKYIGFLYVQQSPSPPLAIVVVTVDPPS